MPPRHLCMCWSSEFDHIKSDPFLPDSLRTKLAIRRTNRLKINSCPTSHRPRDRARKRQPSWQGPDLHPDNISRSKRRGMRSSSRTPPRKETSI
jgi:hypothetical protein